MSANEESRIEQRKGETVRRGAYPEMTWSAIIVGWFLGSLIAISISYAALVLGFSIEGSELAAILGWGILRGIMGRTSIIENNINQTVASAVNGASSGIMFSVPALLILSSKPGLESLKEFDVGLMIFSCIAGAFIGLAFVIPLRKQMIDFQRLPYPSGIAVATILKSPGAGMRKASLLLMASIFSAVVYLWLTNMGTQDDHDIYIGQQLGMPSFLNLTLYGSLMTIGVGFLSGRGGFWFGAGGFMCYWLLAPIMSQYAADDVKDVINPEIRTAMVSDQGLMNDVYAELGEENELVNQLQLLLATPESDGDSPAPNFASLLNASQAEAVLKAVAELDNKWRIENQELVNGIEPENLPSIQSKLAKKLAGHSKAAEVMVSIEALNALDQATADKLRNETNAKQFMASVGAISDLSSEQKSALIAASGAASNYNRVPVMLNKKLFKPTGIGMLIGAAIGGILFAFPLIMSAIGSMRRTAQDRMAGNAEKDELPVWALFTAILVGMVLLIFLANSAVDNMTMSMAILMSVLGTLWIWIAGVIVAECIGRTNWSPLSGMTLIAVTILIVIASAGQLSKPEIILSSMVVGAAICLAVSQASDMMLDLKSGYLVGATPRKQQAAQFVGAWLGPIIVMILMLVLHQSKGIGSDELPAPQASALASVMEGIVNQDVPAYRYTAGGILGFMLAASGLGGIGVLVALGFYMPFNIVLTYSIGCLLRIISNRVCGHRFSEETGIPLAAGLIVGEALIGVGIAIFKIGFG